MHNNLALILTLAGGLSAALVFGYITERLRLSPIVGYLLAGTLVGPYTPVPRLLDRVAATSSRELFTLAVLALALGIAVGSALVFGVSMALGAFLAGVVVGRSDYSLRAASDALPMRDAFAVLFFVSTGMLNPSHLVEQPAIIAAALAVVLVASPWWRSIGGKRSLRSPCSSSASESRGTSSRTRSGKGWV